jgi:hypothetical protein
MSGRRINNYGVRRYLEELSHTGYVGAHVKRRYQSGGKKASKRASTQKGRFTSKRKAGSIGRGQSRRAIGEGERTTLGGRGKTYRTRSRMKRSSKSSRSKGGSRKRKRPSTPRTPARKRARTVVRALGTALRWGPY